MKAFVTGVNGQLGHDVVNELTARGYECVGSDIAPSYTGIQDGTPVCSSKYVNLDITDGQETVRVLEKIRPDWVFHCAAFTAVDAAEEAEQTARAVNADGTRHIAEQCEKLGCKMMYISTDYVFDGQGDAPWMPECRTFTPVNVYGRTKLEGELAVQQTVSRAFIVRIAWVFGMNGKNFVRTMLNLSKMHDSLRVVCDQIGTPTYTLDLARLLVDMMETEKYGIYHATNEGGYISWYEFACEIFKQAGKTVAVQPVTTAEYGASKAARPFNSRLSKDKLSENGFKRLPDWRDALGRYVKALKETDEKERA